MLTFCATAPVSRSDADKRHVELAEFVHKIREREGEGVYNNQSISIAQTMVSFTIDTLKEWQTRHIRFLKIDVKTNKNNSQKQHTVIMMLHPHDLQHISTSKYRDHQDETQAAKQQSSFQPYVNNGGYQYFHFY